MLTSHMYSHSITVTPPLLFIKEGIAVEQIDIVEHFGVH